MKFLIITSALLAVSAASLVTPIALQQSPIHLPVIGANGVPVDTAEVQLARAAHLTAKAEASLRNGDWAVGLSTPWIGGVQSVVSPIAQLQHIPTIGPNGVPVDTAEVQIARANHLAAKAEATARDGLVISAPAASIVGAPIISAAPVLSATIQAQHVPVINSEGVPVDTADVQLARSAHLATKANVQARNGDLLSVSAPILAASTWSAPSWSAPAWSAPIAAVAPQHIPVIQNGVPVEPLEVQVARAAHLSAKAEAITRNGPIISTLSW